VFPLLTGKRKGKSYLSRGVRIMILILPLTIQLPPLLGIESCERVEESDEWHAVLSSGMGISHSR
jgi:hypothetical protein